MHIAYRSQFVNRSLLIAAVHCIDRLIATVRMPDLTIGARAFFCHWFMAPPATFSLTRCWCAKIATNQKANAPNTKETNKKNNKIKATIKIYAIKFTRFCSFRYFLFYHRTKSWLCARARSVWQSFVSSSLFCPFTAVLTSWSTKCVRARVFVSMRVILAPNEERQRERDRGLRKMFIDAILMDYVKCLGH